jgi:hypothetical protein
MAQKRSPKEKTTFLTPTDAARRAGIGRSTLYRAMKDGTISVSKDANGRKRIDAAELARVYDVDTSDTARDVPEASHGTPASSPEVSTMVQSMKARIDLLERENALLERELADAKNEKNRLLGLLEQKALPDATKPASRTLFWDRLFK